MAYDDSSASGRTEPWIQWFCGLKGHEMFCEVERSYIEDGFNLYGLRACVANFSDCLDLILDRIGPDDSDDSHLTQSACTLYGLIHARYIVTSHGLDGMYNKYVNKDFGTCPLLQCHNQPCLPVGLRDEMGSDTVKIYCPKCKNVYYPPPIRSRSHSIDDIGCASVDGASFGTTFPHLFLMTYHNLVPEPLPLDSAYIPRVFGFRVHQSSRSNRNNNDETTASSVAVRSNRRLQAQMTGIATNTNEANQNAADGDVADINNDSARLPQEQDGKEDNTAASPANAVIEKNNSSQSKGNKGTVPTKCKKGAKGKNEDLASSSKRKGKNINNNNSNGDGDGGKVKRQKRGGPKT